MKRYPKYKDSGVEFIGEIPKHWIAKKLRYFCSMKSGNGFTHDLQGRTGLEIPFFKVADTNTPENKLEMLYAQNTVSSQDVSDFKFILHKPNSIVFPKVGAALLLNKRNILAQKSCIDNNMMSLYSDQSNYKFLYYAMLNVDFKRHYRIGGTVPSINESEVGNIPIAYPILSEQTQIANFLDRKTGQIDELIRIKEQRIELLQEQRTALINHAVTKGLNPNVEMKPSREEWIGEIPKHWKMEKIKYIATFVSEKSTPETDAIKISPENVESETGKVLDFYSSYDSVGVRFQAGDVLFNKLRVYLNKVVFAEYDGYSLGEMIVIRPVLQETGKYLFYLMLSGRFIEYCNSISYGVKMPRTAVEDILNTQIPLTSYQEQIQIANFLDRKTEQIDELISTEQRKIELLKEYRQSLISEAVTGKIDVRNEV